MPTSALTGSKRPSPESEADSFAPNKKPANHIKPIEVEVEAVDDDDEAFYSTDGDSSYETDDSSDPYNTSDEEEESDFSEPPPIDSKADKHLIMHKALHATPPYLFRVASSSNSRGLNTPTTIDPLHGYDREYHLSPDSIIDEPDPYNFVRDMVSHHLNWTYSMPSEFSSWTISFLWMFVHAHRKHFYFGEKDVIIYILDTGKLPKHRIYKALDLMRKYDLDFDKDTQRNALGEYLIHGELYNGPENPIWVAVRFEDLLVAVNFDDLFKTFQDPKELKYLHRRAAVLRSSYFKPLSNGAPFYSFGQNDWVLDEFRKLAKCFGPEWEAVVMVALITMRSRDYSPEATQVWIPRAFQGMSMPRLPFDEDVGLRSFHLALSAAEGTDGDIPDARQFMLLLRLLHDRQAVHVEGD